MRVLNSNSFKTRRIATRSLCAGMMHGVQLLQAFARNVGIYLSGRDIGMPEQHLHHAQIGAMIEQVCRKGVAQDMGRQRCAYVGLERVLFNNEPEGLASHARGP